MCGDGDADTYTDENGNLWTGNDEQYIVSGDHKTFSVSSSISGTNDDYIFQNERSAITSAGITYEIPVSNGYYTVNLLFAELWFTTSSSRVFDVLLQNNLVLNDLDLASAHGKYVAGYYSFNDIVVTDGSMTIKLDVVTEQPKINGIELIWSRSIDPTPNPTNNPTPTPTPAPTASPTPQPTPSPTNSPTPSPTLFETRINMGVEGNSIIDGNLWFGDTGYWTTNPQEDLTMSTTDSISGTSLDSLHQTQRTVTTSDQITINIPITLADTYTISIYLAEIEPLKSSNREFDILIDSTLAFDNVNIATGSGGTNTELILQHDVTTTTNDYTLSIIFQKTSSSTYYPIISGLSIIPTTPSPTLSPTPNPTPSPTPSPTLSPTDPTVNPTPNPTKSPTPIPTPSPTEFNFDIKVNCVFATSNVYTDTNGNQWVGDGDYLSSSTNTGIYSDNIAISGTNDDELHQTERSGKNDDILYEFTSIPNGDYTVKLYMAEIYFSASGQRIFDIALQGITVYNDFDPYAYTGGKGVEGILTFEQITVSDGTLSIELILGSKDNPKISALEITRTGEITSVAVNAGGSEYIVDNDGLIWSADGVDFYDTTIPTEVITTTNTISGDTNGAEGLYQSCRQSVDNLGSVVYKYSENGVYDVVLLFAEFEGMTSGERVFDIIVEGEIVENALDVYDSVGSNTALRKEYVLAVEDGELNIEINASAGKAIVCGVQVEQTSNHFAHAVIGDETGDQYISFVDVDDIGFVNIDFNGVGSHTHFPNAELISWDWEWKQNGVTIGTASGESPPTQTINSGVYELSLTVVDDVGNVDTYTNTLEIVPGSGYTGCLAYYYDYSSIGTLTSIPDFLTLVPDVIVSETSLSFALQDNTNAFGDSGLTSNFAAQFRCYIDVEAGETGIYTFALESNDGARLTVEGTVIIDNDGIGSDDTLERATGSVDLSTEGRYYIIVEYFDGSSGSSSSHGLELLYTPPGGTESLVPLEYALLQTLPVMENYNPSSGSVNGGTVVTVEGSGFIFDFGVGGDASIIVVDNEFGDIVTIDPEDITINSYEALSFQMPATAQKLISSEHTIYIVTPIGYSNGIAYTYSVESFDAPEFSSSNTFATGEKFTVITVGPDEKIYAANANGNIFRWEVSYDASSGTYSNANYLKSSAIQDAYTTTRVILGISFNPNDDPSNPIVYVAHSQLFHKQAINDKLGDVTMVSGTNLDIITQFVTKFPVSDHDHALNGMVWDAQGILHLSNGGNTNAGINNGQLTSVNQLEKYYSACIIGINPNDNGFSIPHELTYDTNDYPTSFDDGVYVMAAGLRNGYGITYHPTYDNIYATDNGPNPGYGDKSTSCDTSANDPWGADKVLHIQRGHYYGHPNRLRGAMTGQERECIYRDYTESGDEDYTEQLEDINAGSGGMSVYFTNNFGGQWKDSLLAVVYKNDGYQMVLDDSDNGDSILATTQLGNAWSSALDVTVDPRGAIWFAKYQSSQVTYITPVDDVNQYTELFVLSTWPNMGPLTGGTTIKIRGYNFGTVADTTVYFGSSSGPQCTVTAVGTDGPHDTITCTTPDFSPYGSYGVQDVLVISNSGQEFGLYNGYTFVAALTSTPRRGVETFISKPDTPVSGLSSYVAASVETEKYVLFGGGQSNIYEFNIVDDSWNTIGTAPSANQGTGMVVEVYGGLIYVFGGSSTTSTMRSYNPSTNTFTTLATYSSSTTTYSASAIIGDKIYIFGGTISGSAVDTVIEYDIGDNSYTTLTSLPTATTDAAAVAYDSKVYIFGGRTTVGGTPVSTSYVFDPTDGSGGSFTTISNLNTGVANAGTAIEMDEKLIIIGGENGSGAVSTVQSYDPSTNSFSGLTDVPTTRTETYPVGIGHVIFIAGGVGSDAHEALIFL